MLQNGKESKHITEIVELKLNDLGQTIVDCLKRREKKIDGLLSRAILVHYATPTTIHRSTTISSVDGNPTCSW